MADILDVDSDDYVTAEQWQDIFEKNSNRLVKPDNFFPEERPMDFLDRKQVHLTRKQLMEILSIEVQE